jgi:thioredoxin reductase (NADPH)
MYDIIVIGAGPAGISCALYAKRAGANVLVLYHGTSNLERATSIENYYGFINGISGEDLYNSGIKQAENLDIKVKDEEVLSIQQSDSNFVVHTISQEYNSKAIVIATCNKKLRPNIDGVLEFEGRGISYCAICDGFFYRGKNVAVIGNGDFALNEANELKKVVGKVTILTNGESIDKYDDFAVCTKKISAITR